MNICFISNLYPPELLGGAEKHISRVAESLNNRGHDVSVISTTSDRKMRFKYKSQIRNGVNIYRYCPLNLYPPIEHNSQPFWKKPIQNLVDMWNPHSYRMVRQKLEDISPDIIHISNYNGMSPSVFKASSEIDSPVFHTINDYALLHPQPSMFVGGSTREFTTLLRPYRYAMKEAVDDYVDTVISPSEFTLRKHLDHGMFNNTKCIKIPYGVEISTNTVPTYVEENNFLYVGRLSDEKGVDNLISTFKEISDPSISLDILGTGPKEDELKSLADNDNKIKFHGFVSGDELLDFYRNAKYTIVPSKWYEVFGIVIIESYSFGTPVIGADIGGIPELIHNERTGITFKQDSKRSLRSALKHAIEIYSENIVNETFEKSKSFSVDNHISNLTEEYYESIN